MLPNKNTWKMVPKTYVYNWLTSKEDEFGIEKYYVGGGHVNYFHNFTILLDTVPKFHEICPIWHLLFEISPAYYVLLIF